eukprot:Nk52_evm17s2356 gene=Nk52_evmTU17s2356
MSSSEDEGHNNQKGGAQPRSESPLPADVPQSPRDGDYNGADGEQQKPPMNNDSAGQNGPVGGANGDDPSAKMFVGGLSWGTTREGLQDYFNKYGEIEECVIMMDTHSGRSRGFGFLTFKDPSSIEKVVESGPHVLDQRTIDAKRAIPRGQRQEGRGGFRDMPKTKKVFIGGLPISVTEENLKTYFVTFGEVTDCHLMLDRETQRSRGFGFVTFANDDSVENVCTERWHTFDGKSCEVKRAEPRNHVGGGFRGRGGFRGGRGGYNRYNNQGDMYGNQWAPGYNYGPPQGYGPPQQMYGGYGMDPYNQPQQGYVAGGMYEQNPSGYGPRGNDAYGGGRRGGGRGYHPYDR